MTHIRFPDPDEDAQQLVECEPMGAADGTSLAPAPPPWCDAVLTTLSLTSHQSLRSLPPGLRCRCLAGALLGRRVQGPESPPTRCVSFPSFRLAQSVVTTFTASGNDPCYVLDVASRRVAGA